jgi:hypothetical protein
MSKSEKGVIETMLGAVLDDGSKEHSRLKIMFKQVASHPIKLVAAFISAPVLIVRLAVTVRNPLRRAIATIGLIFAVTLAYLAGTFLGTVAGAFFVMSNIGILAGVGFFVGSFLSVFLSLTFSVFVLNAVSFLFLKLSTQEVVDYLQSLSADQDDR